MINYGLNWPITEVFLPFFVNCHLELESFWRCSQAFKTDTAVPIITTSSTSSDQDANGDVVCTGIKAACTAVRKAAAVPTRTTLTQKWIAANARLNFDPKSSAARAIL